MSHREDIVAACRALLAAREAGDTAERQRNSALIAVYTDDGISQRQLAPTVQQWLREEGFTDEQIAQAGVSEGNVKRVLASRGLS